MIPVSEPIIGKKEIQYVNQVLKSGWISSKGEFIKKFEKEFVKFCDRKFGVAVTNGTAALHLALVSLDIRVGDEVIIPTFTMAATVFAVIYTGAKPVLADADPETFNIDPKKIEEKITKKTKAIIPVHIYGHPCDMKPILGIAQKYKLYVIEDAAEAHGAEYYGKKVGGIGDVGCFSFYGNKIITTGEGGMVITNNKKIFDKARSLKNMAFGEGEDKFKHKDIGFNYRMTNMQAAVGVAQLENISQIIARKRLIAKTYSQCLHDIRGIKLPIEKKWAKNVYWMYAILVNRKKRDWLMDKLAKKGIETRPFFTPIHLQPVFKKIGLFKNEKYPIAEMISKKGLYLPSGTALKDKEIKYISQKLEEILL